jgi:ATP-dependent Lon protease
MAPALHDLKRLVVLEPENVEARFELAEALFGEQRFADAASQLETALAHAPEHVNARRLLARSYLADGRPVPAERVLREGVRLRPDRPELRDGLADVMEAVHRLDDALLQLEEADRLAPDDVRRLAVMADLFLKRRLLARARSVLERAVEVAPDRLDLRRHLAEVVTELGGTPDRPESPLDRGPEFLLGRTREVLGTSALKAAASGPLRDAAVALRLSDLKAARRALVLVPSGGEIAPLVHFLRGEVLLAEGDREKAEAAFARAALAGALAPLAAERLGELLLARGAGEEAVAQFGRASQGDDPSPTALIGKGDAHWSRGRRDEAARAWERALVREPGGPAAARLAVLRRRPSVDEEKQGLGRIGALGWDPTGGTVSPIEAVAVPGKGELIFSGNVGKKGQEAAKVAYSCLKARAVELNVEERMSGHDLHLHFADTEMQKDGPSAGLALALAGLSALTGRPLRPYLAATGEVTLSGGVKPVGGLHEKLVAACLAGVRTVLVPRKNLLDARELPPEVTTRLGLVYVDSLREAVDAAFPA